MVGGSNYLHLLVTSTAAHHLDLLLLEGCFTGLFGLDRLFAGRFTSFLESTVVVIIVGFFLSVPDWFLHPLLLMGFIMHFFLLGIAPFSFWSLLILEFFHSDSILHQIQNSVNTLSLLQVFGKINEAIYFLE